MKRKNDLLTKERTHRDYTDKLSEIAKEFRFSDAVLETDAEIDDRHLIDNMSIRRGNIDVDNSGETAKVEKDIED